MLSGEERGIVVGNAQEGLMQWVRNREDVSGDAAKRLVWFISRTLSFVSTLVFCLSVSQIARVRASVCVRVHVLACVRASQRA